MNRASGNPTRLISSSHFRGRWAMQTHTGRIRFRALRSSWWKKRAALLLLVSVGSVAAQRRQPNPAEQLPLVPSAQLDVEFDGDRHDKSQWGEANLRFVGSD